MKKIIKLFAKLSLLSIMSLPLPVAEQVTGHVCTAPGLAQSTASLHQSGSSGMCAHVNGHLVGSILVQSIINLQYSGSNAAAKGFNNFLGDSSSKQNRSIEYVLNVSTHI